MPKYSFVCIECGNQESRYTSIDTKTIQCNCGETMNRKMPIISGHPQVRELVDKDRNVSHLQDQKKLMEDRKREYYWAHEVPKMVDSGVYSLQTMLENKWVYYNDKGELCTRTVPPESE